MRIARIIIENFRGISKGELFFSGHTVLVGDNNTCKSTVLEAIDLVLGPERLSKRPVIDEHDFYAGHYINTEGNPVEVKVEVVVVDLIEEQARHFRDHLEWWNEGTKTLLDGPPPEGTDQAGVLPALRVGFTGNYDKEEDDFTGSTYFLSPVREDGARDVFRTSDKRLCGFLFLRTLRTGSRALSLERGSLLDIILRLQEKRLQMWEEVLDLLRKLPVAEKREIGISDILTKVQESVRSFVTSDWADSPHMRVTDLTRENLRRALTVFMGTGAKREDGSDYAAPFQHQGTGTINTLVLALLSLIAELKQNVMFAMEEPEIALPPHTQKRIIDSVRKKSAQAIFTSHSPYVLEEFEPRQVLVLIREGGNISGTPAEYPPTVKPKKYREEFRKRFCEALLARRVLITEGRTEYDAFPAAARRLHELHPDEFKTLEALGIALVNAESDSQVAPLGEHFAKVGKVVFAVFDKQAPTQKAAIEAVIPHAFEAESGFEDIVLHGTPEAALRRFALSLVANGDWPPHLAAKTPTATTTLDSLQDALREYLTWSKGAGGAADLIGECTRDEVPKFVVDTLLAIQAVAEPTQTGTTGSSPGEEAKPTAAEPPAK
ncbi:AAA family ATPase [Candidatus Methylomirabilis sp.]|uniref:ATP-dependent nuclease n=1 Tax=Candidatus Methylomirabilis sp. TaxID=2032687 RepID=UPI0030760ECE